MNTRLAMASVAGMLTLSLSLPCYAIEGSISIDTDPDPVDSGDIVDEFIESDIDTSQASASSHKHDIEGAKQAIRTGVLDMAAIIDVSDYEVTRSDFGDLYSWFYDEVVVGQGMWNVDGPLRWSYDVDGCILYVRPSYKVNNKNTFSKMQATYETNMTKLLSYVPSTGTDAEKAKAVFDAICDTVSYAKKESTYSYSAYGALVDKTAYCEGYSKLMVDALRRVGVKSVMRVNDDHAWNLVYIGGNWYNVDATFGDSYGNANDLFFLKSDTAFAKLDKLYLTHSNDGFSCNSTSYDSSVFAKYPLLISKWNVKVMGNPVFTGSARTLSKSQISVTCGARNLNLGTDYTVSYKNNTNAGVATIVLTGKGKHTGSVTKTFKISAAKLSNCNVTNIKNLVYTGKALKQSPVLKLGSYKLKSGTDYTVTYKNNVKAGKATVVITGKGNFTGSITRTFTISKRAISSAKVSKVSAAKYTGKAIKPKFKVTYNGITLKSGTDYTVKYSNNVKRGTAKIVITGKGNFKGTITKTFKIK